MNESEEADLMADLIDRYSEQHIGTEVDSDRLRAALEDTWAFATSEACPLREGILELESLGGRLFMPPAKDGMCEVRMGVAGSDRSIPLATFPLSQILTRPQG